MTGRPRLTYFDAPVSRGEECRLALRVSGVDFDDRRLKRDEWLALKPTTPFGTVPLLEMPGQPVLAQSNAILVFIGRTWGLHPKDDFEAARHEAMMAHIEELRNLLGTTMRIVDAEEKKRAREKLASEYIPAWAAHANRWISESGPFFAGNSIHVVDFKILMIVRWIRGGALDHIPTTAFDGASRLIRVHDAVDADPRVRAWYASK